MAHNVFSEPYTLGRMAEVLAEPGYSSQQCRNRLAHLAKGTDRGDGQFITLLHSYGLPPKGSGPTAHRQYPFSEICKAKVLFTLMEQGIADGHALRAADFGLVSKRVDHSMPAELQKAIFDSKFPPIMHAVASIERGGDARFALTYFWHPKNGQRQYRGEIVFGDDDIPPPPKGFVPRSTVLIHLPPLILPLIAKAGRERVN
jgi:hypothetical protein